MSYLNLLVEILHFANFHPSGTLMLWSSVQLRTIAIQASVGGLELNVPRDFEQNFHAPSPPRKNRDIE